MLFKNNLTIKERWEAVEIVPLINVILLLLLFFILASPLTSAPGIKVKMPKAITSDVIKNNNFVITITDDDVLYTNGKVTTLKELERELAQRKDKGLNILIKSDRRARVASIVNIWNLCRNLGLEKINLATDQQ